MHTRTLNKTTDIHRYLQHTWQTVGILGNWLPCRHDEKRKKKRCKHVKADSKSNFSRYDLNRINGQTKKVIGRVFFAPKNCNERVDGIKLLNTRKHPFSESLQPINLLLGSVLMTFLIMGTTLFWKALIWVEQGKTILDFFFYLTSFITRNFVLNWTLPSNNEFYILQMTAIFGKTLKNCLSLLRRLPAHLGKHYIYNFCGIVCNELRSNSIGKIVLTVV